MADMTKISWWQWLPFFRWRIVTVVDSADNVPERLPRNGAALVGDRAHPKWIVFDCPCRRGHRIMLNIDKARSPRWSTTSQGLLSISPSVDYQHLARRCHYFITRGRIKWVHESKKT